MSLKVCSRCKQPKTFSAFWKGLGYKDGIQSICKECKTAYQTKSRKLAAECRLAAERRCSKCNTVKRVNDFSKSKNMSSWCRECCRKSSALWRAQNRNKLAQLGRARSLDPKYKEWTKNYGRAYRLFNKYGLDLQMYESLLAKQDGKCGVCKKTVEQVPGRWGVFHVDHCHKNGKVRGLLCYRCNAGLGGLMDDPELLIAAVDYLTKAID